MIPFAKDQFFLCEDNFKKIKGLNTNDKISSNLIEISVEKISKLNDIIIFLKEERIFNIFDEKTENNITYITKNWIEQSLFKKGITKSKEINKCLLCNREIDCSVKELFEKYEDYFKNEKGKFEAKLEQIESDLQLLKIDLQKINNNLQNKVEELSRIFLLKNK